MVVFIYCLVVILILSQQKRRKRGIIWLEAYNKQMQKNTVPWWTVVIRQFISIFSSSDKEMRQKFLAAGFYDTKYAVYFMPIKYTFLIIALCGTYWLGHIRQWETNSLIAIMAIWLVCILILPDSYLAMRSKSLKIKVSNKLPYLIDLLAVCVQTGMTIEASMTYLSKEMTSFDKDLGVILNKTNDRTKIIGLEQALEELYIRVPSNEMRSFVMTINQSLQYGTSIYNVLTTLSADIREVQILSIEESVGKLSAKMSIPLILFIMFPIIIIVAAPGVLRALGV
jgi:tight adherence protein C